MKKEEGIKLCTLLISSKLRKYSIFSYMHNLKTNFDKILEISKLALTEYMLADGNFFKYRNLPKLSDIEIVALSITSEALGIDSENLLFSKLRTEYSGEFPNLIDRSNYNRRRKRLQDYIALVAQPISEIINPDNHQFIIDSVPVPICQNVRISRTSICREDLHVQPSRGYHASHRLHYYGFKMQLIISKAGVPVSMGITAANVHDVHYLSQLENLELNECELIADKGYLSLPYQTTLFEQDRIRLITPLRNNMKKRTTLWNPSYRYVRKRVETLFSQLCDHLYIKRNYAKSLSGLFTRMCSKISGVAVLQLINFKNNKPINHLKHALAA
ncbi:DDE family transposase [Arcticibacter tournemirensis]|nr:IS982 family transposase [Arcticibacter tournemirensis]TQM49927.1 DDE family transposase [Arcticibacter tournemirensis]